VQPDPSTFLRGVRREALRLLQRQRDSLDPAQQETLRRGAEALALLEVRRTTLPSSLVGAKTRQIRLLEEAIALLQSEGLAIPPVAKMAAGSLEAEAGSDQIVEAYECRMCALEQCLAALAPSMRSSRERADALCAQVCDLEADVRAAARSALSELKLSEDRLINVVEEGAPTDQLVTEYLRRRLPAFPNITASGVRRLKGVNTKEIFFLEIDGHEDWPRDAVLRRNRVFDTVGNLVADEFAVLQWAYQAGLKVPRPLLSDYENEKMHRAFVISERLPGRSHSAVELGPAHATIVREMAQTLGALHRLDIDGVESTRSYGDGSRNRTLAMIDRFYRWWKLNQIDPSPTLEAAYVWVRSNVDVIGDSVALVHGDFNLRNILIHGGHISGILDWEMAHVGHPAEDLAYCREEVERAMPWTEFMRIYIEHGGKEVSEEEVRYFQVWTDVFGVSSIFPAAGGYCTGKHDDLLIGAVGYIEYDYFLNRLGTILRSLWNRDTAAAGRTARSR
jgi:aminoglycoside phosphotransferase (APT) family kinase protein